MNNISPRPWTKDVLFDSEHIAIADLVELAVEFPSVRPDESSVSSYQASATI
jgi:hypothetical protein